MLFPWNSHTYVLIIISTIMPKLPPPPRRPSGCSSSASRSSPLQLIILVPRIRSTSSPKLAAQGPWPPSVAHPACPTGGTGMNDVMCLCCASSAVTCPTVHPTPIQAVQWAVSAWISFMGRISNAQSAFNLRSTIEVPTARTDNDLDIVSSPG